MNELVRRLQEIYVLLDDCHRRTLRPEGLTPTQYTLLRCVDENDSPGLSISRLAEMMLCTRGNVTRLVRRLDDLRLVSTRGDERDQRLVLVSLTDEGAARLRRATDLLADADARRFEAIPARDLRTMTELADTVAAALAKDLTDDAER